MKTVNIRTKVHGSPQDIFKRFEKSLLLKLTPPFINVEISRFDGQKKDDEIHIISSCLGNYQSWVNIISESFESDDECYFTDVAREMPFPFTSWSHTHKIRKIDDSSSYIQDHIRYSCTNKILEKLAYPIVYFLMYYRKPIYIDTFTTNDEA